MDLPTTGPLLRPTLLAAGWTDDELRRLRRRGDLTAITGGAYVKSSDPRLRRSEAKHALLVVAAVPRVAPDSVISHVSAAVQHGLPIWNVPMGRVHTTRPQRSGGLRTGRLHVHTAPLGPEDITDIGGIAVTSVVRTLLDLARTVGFEQAVVIVDAALHRHFCTHDDLWAGLGRMTRWRGAPAARRVVSFADPGAASPGESRSRVAMARLGLPTPVLQWEVQRGGVLLGEVDFGWPEFGRVGEFDGFTKYAIRSEDLGMTRWIWPEIDDFTGVARRLALR